MRVRSIVLVLLLTALMVAGAMAIAQGIFDGSEGGRPAQPGPGDQGQIQNQSQEQIQNQSQEQVQGQEGQEYQPGVVKAASLREQLQEREQEPEQEQPGQFPEKQRLLAGYRNVSAFVQLLLNEDYATSLLGEAPEGIGSQISRYAQDLNASLQAQVQAEERIESRNAFIRFFMGGDQEASRILEQEAIRNVDRIREMQQLLPQCQTCDPEVQSILRDQLQQMEEEQSRLQQMARKEQQDTGLFGWIGR